MTGYGSGRRVLSLARRVGALLAALALASASPGAETTSAVFYRIFLQDGDGRSIASAGDYTEIGGRVVFSLPLGLEAVNTPVRLVSIPADRVDWSTTRRYADAARYDRYVTTRGDPDFARLRVEAGRALTRLASGDGWDDALAVRARLTDWVARHGYRRDDALQVVTRIDEAITTAARQDGHAAPMLMPVAPMAARVPMPLLPIPGLEEMVAQAMIVAAVTPVPAERLALLETVLRLLDAAGDGVPRDWKASVRATAERERATERERASAYAAVGAAALERSSALARAADVRGVFEVIEWVRERDAALGNHRPNQVAAVVAAVDARLREAQALRLARDHWRFHLGSFRGYQAEAATHIDRFAQERPLLDDVRLLAGPDIEELEGLETRLSQLVVSLDQVTPAGDARGVHELFRRAFVLARHAVATRREAVAAGDLDRARDAGAAAAGALLLFDRATVELDRSLAPPDLP